MYLKRCEGIFGLSLTDPIIGYITLNSLCTYNSKESYFFVSVFSKYPQKTIMHELFHLYTHRAFEDTIPDKKQFNDIKESLTEILNLEFKDLMGEAVDVGYPQHQEYRSIVRDKWNETRNIQTVIDKLKQ